MTGNIFLDCVFLFLICYGIVSIFYNLSEFLLRRFCRYPQKIFLVSELTHESETLECDIRCAISKSIKNKCALVIVCSGLDMEEYSTLWYLTDRYDHIIITTRDDLVNKLETAASISASQ